MANYRQAHVGMWRDEWFLDLEPLEKLLFIYFFTNESTSMTGLYKLPFKVMQFETGLDAQFLTETIGKFSKANKVYYQDGVVYVVNMQRYHETKSPKVRTRLDKDIAAIPDCELKHMYLKNTIGYQYPIDTSPQLKEDIKEEEESAQAQRPKGRKQKAKPLEDDKSVQHPALLAYRHEARLHVPITLRQEVMDAIGNKPDDVTRWQTTVHNWIASGYNKQNIRGLTEAYQDGWTPQKNGNGKPPPGPTTEELYPTFTADEVT